MTPPIKPIIPKWSPLTGEDSIVAPKYAPPEDKKRKIAIPSYSPPKEDGPPVFSEYGVNPEYVRSIMDEAATSPIPTPFSNPLVAGAAVAATKGLETLGYIASRDLSENISATGQAIRGAVGGIGQLAGAVSEQEGLVAKARLLGRALIYDGLVRPMLVMPLESALSYDLDPLDTHSGPLTREEAVRRGEEATANLAGLYLGLKVGTSFTKAGRAAEAVKRLGDIKKITPNTVAMSLAGITDDVVHTTLIDELAGITRFELFKKGVIEGTSGGMLTGISQGETPEERFQNAFQYGVAGAILGGGLEMAFGVKGKKIAASDVVQAARVNNAAQVIMNLPASDALGISTALSEGIPYDAAMVKQVPLGETRIIHDLETLSPTVKDMEAQLGKPRYFHRSHDGKVSILVDNISRDELVEEAIRVDAALAKGVTPERNVELSTHLNQTFKKQENLINMVSDFAAKIPTVYATKFARILLGDEQYRALADHINSLVLNDPEIKRLKLEGDTSPHASYWEATEPEIILKKQMSALETVSRAVVGAAEEAKLNGTGTSDMNWKGFPLDFKPKVFYIEPRHVDAFKRTGFIERHVGTVDGREVAVLNSVSNGKGLLVKALDNVKEFVVPRSKFKPLSELLTADFVSGTGSKDVLSFKSEILGTMVSKQTVHINDIKADLLPEELAILESNSKKFAEATEELAQERARKLNATGYAIERTAEGRLRLKPRKGTGIIHVLDNAEQMDHFLPATSGAAPDPLANVAGTRIIPPAGEDAYLVSPAGERVEKGRRLEKKWDALRLKIHPIIHTAQVLRSLENLSNHKIWTKAILPRQMALMRTNAEKMPYIKRLADIAEVKMRGWDKSTREAVSTWLGSSSYHEFLHSVKPSDLSVATANKHITQLLALGTGLEPLKRVNKYLLRKTIILTSANKHQGDWYQNGILNQGKLETLLSRFEFNELAGGPLTPYEWSLVKDLTITPTEPYNVNHVREMITKYVLDAPTREEFVNLSGMKPEHVEVAKELEDFFVKLADHLNIPESKRLFRYLPHLQEFEAIKTFEDYSPIMGLDPVSKAFFADLQRMGLQADLVKDPIDILIRYVNAGFKDRYYKPTQALSDIVINDFINDRAYKAIGNGKKTREAWARYIRDVVREMEEVGTPGETIAHDAADMALEGIGAIDKTGRKSLIKMFTEKFTISNLIKNVEMATQGMRAVAGLRDVVTAEQLLLIRFGPSFVNRSGIVATRMEAWKSRKWMREAGITPGQVMELSESYDTQALRETTEAALGNIGATAHLFDKFRELTFQLSGQPTVFETYHALVHNTVSSITREALNDWAVKKVTRAKMEKKIKLETYSAGVIKEFNDLANAGKLDDATLLLAQDAGFELVNHFGRANSPQLMWSKLGKLGGQFGQWPLWYLNGLADQLARATPARQAEIAAWIGLSMGAFHYAQQQTGFNLQSWSLDPRNSISYKGSPWFQALMINGRDLLSSNEQDRARGINSLKSTTSMSNGVLIPFPLYLRRDIPEAIGRANQFDPALVVFWKILGGSVDREQFPPP